MTDLYVLFTMSAFGEFGLGVYSALIMMWPFDGAAVVHDLSSIAK